MQRFNPDILEHPNRRTIYDLVVVEPGINFRELARRLGMAAGTARHHLTKLCRSGLIHEQGHHMTCRFFVKEAFAADWQHIVLMREPGLRQVYDLVAAEPGSCQKALLARLEELGCQRSTAQHRLGRLAAAGEFTVRLQGRLKLYYVVMPTGARLPMARTSAPLAPSPAAMPAALA